MYIKVNFVQLRKIQISNLLLGSNLRQRDSSTCSPQELTTIYVLYIIVYSSLTSLAIILLSRSVLLIRLIFQEQEKKLLSDLTSINNHKSGLDEDITMLDKGE